MAWDRRWVDERLRVIYRQWVPRWHFEMLNDAPRGQAYADALATLNLTGKTVLDIGAGSGLLAMIAVRSGVKHVYACEMVRPIAEKAEEIVRQNGLENRITIIPKSSFEMEIGREMPEHAQLMVSETFDYAFVGERFLRSLRHAKQTLLKPDAVLVPCGMKLCGVLIESADIHGMNCVERSQGFDVSGVNEFSAPTYFPVRLMTRPHRILSGIETLVEADLHDGIPCSMTRTVEFTAVQHDIAHRVAFWFAAVLAPGVTLTNSPEQPQSHWTQAFATFCKPIRVQKNRPYLVRVTVTDESVSIAPVLNQ